MLTGSTTDISVLLQFHFYEEVFYTHVDNKFPSESTESRGFFVGFGESVGDAMTFKVLTDDTCKILFRSNVRSASDKLKYNKRLLVSGATDPSRLSISGESDSIF